MNGRGWNQRSLRSVVDFQLLIVTQSSVRDLTDGVQITGVIPMRYDEILRPDALSFIAKLHRTFESRRRECLRAAEENN